jgi:large subunit ribosomal protein L22
MGRAYRYQRRLTHIILSVAERADASRSDLVTRVEEPASAKPGKKAKPATEKAKVTKKVTKKA